jgi:preprotein translocase subunit SecE
MIVWMVGSVFDPDVEETREELRKCSWPTWQELKGSTLLIGMTVAFLGVFVCVIDTILFHVFIR